VKRYCIDYRQGGMGNTILTHILYACEKVDLDFDTFFSNSGNSHKISMFNKSNLTAEHLLEFPNSDLNCIIQLYSDDWNLPLQYKMSYEKWHGDIPMLDTYTKFFNIHSVVDADKLWKEYYFQYKDPQWPECVSYQAVQFLPEYIQKEIYQTYRHPEEFVITNDKLLLKFLSKCYFDLFILQFNSKFSNSAVYPISKYFSNNCDILKNKIEEVFGWKWNQKKSEEFYHRAMNENNKYFLWLDNIKNICNQTINFCECQTQIDIWEKAVVIAKVCEYFKLDPFNLNWDSEGCFLNNNNVSLINYLKEVNHGQAI
jgi:hypothetical protein